MDTREEHLEFCKARAREYLQRGEVVNAIMYMLSDLSKHPETAGAGESMALLGLMYAQQHDYQGAVSFIEGFR